MFLLLHVRAPAERREAAAREEKKGQRQARKRACGRPPAGWPAAGAIARLARTRGAAASCLSDGGPGSCQLEIEAEKSSFPARRRLCLI